MSETTLTLPPGTPPKVLAMVQKMALEADTFGGDALSATFDILNNILKATDEVEIFKAANAGTTSGQDYLETGFRLREDGISSRKSTKNSEGGLPYYYQLSVTDFHTGEPLTVSCGGLSAVAVITTLRDNGILAKYEEEGGMPLMFTEKAAGNGNVLLVQPYVPNGRSKK